jgi:hypothetical protein
MPSNQLKNDSKNKAPFNDFDLEAKSGALIQAASPRKQSDLIEKIAIKPGQQCRIYLGSYSEANPPTGFSVELNPDPVPANSVVTEVSSLGLSQHYKLILHIANYGTKTITAEVRRLIIRGNLV